MSTSIIELSARLDRKVTEFGLAANASGEYPWQAQQRMKGERRRRTVAGVAGSVAIGGGLAYGATKAGDALKKRYGVKTGADGMKAGAADLINRADDKIKAGVVKAKDYAGQGMQRVKTAAQPVMDATKRKLGALKGAGAAYRGARMGIMGKGGMGVKGALMKVARGVIHASRADKLVELEAKLDKALQQFA